MRELLVGGHRIVVQASCLQQCGGALAVVDDPTWDGTIILSG
jgi:hypothetical protein